MMFQPRDTIFLNYICGSCSVPLETTGQCNKSQFFHSTMWFLRIKVKQSEFLVGTFICHFIVSMTSFKIEISKYPISNYEPVI